MPYPFTLPTTSSFSFSSSFTCESHPSLPLNASTHRGVVRDTLKKFKRLPPIPNPRPLLPHLLPPLLPPLPLRPRRWPHPPPLPPPPRRNNRNAPHRPQIQWRPTLSSLPPSPAVSPPPENHLPRIRPLLYPHHPRRSPHPPIPPPPPPPLPNHHRPRRNHPAPNRHLLRYQIPPRRSLHIRLPIHPLRISFLASPSNDISPPTIRALRSLALAEATLLAVLKDDPYPAIVLQQRNENDTEWMYKSPDIPKVRAHLFARLCLAAAEHASQAYALVNSHKINADFIKYLDDLRRTARAKACRFFGIDAELGGEQGKGIGWLWAGLKELGVEREGKHGSSSIGEKAKSSLMKGLKKEWTERREDKKIEKGLDWGADAGRLEERRVIEMLEGKWVRQNDTIMTQPIPPIGPLLAQMPTGREIHTVKPFQPPLLEPNVLEAMRAPPDRSDEYGNYPSSDEETAVDSSMAGAFPGTPGEYRTGTPNYY
ncbi:hypothetical protein QC764_109700 [Podospora pseudoanserina]|uniref:pH-response regulator protein palC n=1 Tax=Podospora pseudoanserina TaxID=2609844 RepID=A0ABR0INJ4_9PEZI|nr:hypothetical protein QC764_109700 [Podospora pseudoanserina]